MPKNNRFLQLNEIRDRLYVRLDVLPCKSVRWYRASQREQQIKAEIDEYCRCESCIDSDEPCRCDCDDHLCSGCREFVDEQRDHEYQNRVDQVT